MPPRWPVAPLREPASEEERFEKVRREVSHVFRALKHPVEISVWASKIVKVVVRMRGILRIRLRILVPSRQRVVRAHDLPELLLELFPRARRHFVAVAVALLPRAVVAFRIVRATLQRHLLVRGSHRVRVARRFSRVQM